MTSSSWAVLTSLVEGNRKPPKLGYHVIINRGADDNGEEGNAFAALQERETISLEHPWNSPPDVRIGISPLRERLEELLGEITGRAFPELRSKTRQKLANAEKKLKNLGVPRQTERERQQYPIGITSNFQALVHAALNADFSGHAEFDRNTFRLITDFHNFARMYFFESEIRNNPQNE
ncbi:hypothetical protein ColLi_10959 [Colletotrichum liriopes]|uniref:Dynamin stalk domain-containing protein n=1 Tax=Colletotrichum liriopes TaxID=708192 RepID=A0AA37LXX7_9PEZI|nr:hypothetical protein ColLi_10959 [Colletotrichum liriopes]